MTPTVEVTSTLGGGDAPPSDAPGEGPEAATAAPVEAGAGPGGVDAITEPTAGVQGPEAPTQCMGSMNGSGVSGVMATGSGACIPGYLNGSLPYNANLTPGAMPFTGGASEGKGGVAASLVLAALLGVMGFMVTL